MLPLFTKKAADIFPVRFMIAFMPIEWNYSTMENYSFVTSEPSISTEPDFNPACSNSACSP